MYVDEEKEFSQIRKTSIKNKEVLEVGCGDGRLSFRLAKVAKKVVAIDPEKKKVNAATAKIRGQKNLKFLVGKGEKLGFPNSSFDTVFYSLSFHHIPKNKQYVALLEAARVLRKTGNVIIYEPIASGQVQKIFLLFNDEKDALDEVYRTIRRAKEAGLFRVAEKSKFSIKWEFKNFQELLDYFSRKYGKSDVERNIANIKKLIKNKKSPIILEDRLILIKLVQTFKSVSSE